MQHMLAALGVMLEWHNPNHFDVDKPSRDLVALWKHMSSTNQFSPLPLEDSDDEDADEAGCISKGAFTTEERHLILNGILFPVWRMKACEHNANAFVSGNARPRPIGPILTYTNAVPAHKPYMEFHLSKRLEARFTGLPMPACSLGATLLPHCFHNAAATPKLTRSIFMLTGAAFHSHSRSH